MEFQGSFTVVLNRFKSVSRKFKRFFKDVQRKIQISFKGVSRMIKKCFEGALWVFQWNFKSVPRKF